jgi:hypothetical protein
MSTFELLTEADARRIVENDVRIAEFSADRVRAWRRLTIETSTAAERTAARQFVLGVSYPCARCGKFAFSQPGTPCYWCRP